MKTALILFLQIIESNEADSTFSGKFYWSSKPGSQNRFKR